MSIGGTDWTSVSVGQFTSAALRGVPELGDAYGCGTNSTGVIGDGTKTNRPALTPMYPGGTWQMYAASVPYTLPAGIDGTRTVTVWYTDEASTYTTLTDTILLADVAFSINDGAAAATTQTVWLKSYTTLAQDMKVVPPLDALSVSAYHAVGIAPGGSLWAWGSNDYREVSPAAIATVRAPVRVGNDTWRSVAAGTCFTVGVRTDGSLWGWGSNAYSVLGMSMAIDAVARAGAHRPVERLDDRHGRREPRRRHQGERGRLLLGKQPRVPARLHLARLPGGPDARSRRPLVHPGRRGDAFTMGLTPEGDVFQWGEHSAAPATVTLTARRHASRARTPASRRSCSDGSLWTWGAEPLRAARSRRFGRPHLALSRRHRHGLGDVVRGLDSRRGRHDGWRAVGLGTGQLREPGGRRLDANPRSDPDRHVDVLDGRLRRRVAHARAAGRRPVRVGDNSRGYLGNLGDAAPNVPTICGTGWQPYDAAVEYTFPTSTDMTATVPMFYRMSDGFLYWASDDIYVDVTPPSAASASTAGSPSPPRRR